MQNLTRHPEGMRDFSKEDVTGVEGSNRRIEAEGGVLESGSHIVWRQMEPHPSVF